MNRENFDTIISQHSQEISCDLNTDVLFEQTVEMVNFLKIKGLTIRQAQLLLRVTSDFLLDEKLV